MRDETPGVLTLGASDFGLSASDFGEVKQLARRAFGLDLKDGKEALVMARLGKRVREGNYRSFAEYLEHVRADRTGLELANLIDALTTNFTSFLREPVHFAFLCERILPSLARRTSFTVWSAGCATGEEPYSLAFVLLDALGFPPRQGFEVLATDISNRALEAARRGVYPADRFECLPAGWSSRYLQKGSGNWQGHYRIRPDVARHVRWERRNLMEAFDGLPQFPVIFCRNVMIYFDKPTQEGLVRRFADRLEPGGYLMIGHSEGLMGMDHSLKFEAPAIYRKPGGGRG